MGNRIKTVWILSLASALVLIGVQGYWLYTQYRYVIDSYMEDTARKILTAGEEEYKIRKEKWPQPFSFSLNRNTEYMSDEDGTERKMSTMAFSSGDPVNISNERIRHILDSVSQIPGERKIVKSIIHSDNSLPRLPAGEEPADTLASSVSRFNMTIPVGISEDLIVMGVHRAFVDEKIPFSEQLMDSVVYAAIPGISLSYTPWEIEDTALFKSYWENVGTLFSPAMEVCYIHNPFGRKGIRIGVEIPPQPLFMQMAGQLFLSFGLILLLIGCLVFQIKTILRQHRVGELRQQFVNTMIHELRRPVQTLKTFVSFLGDREMRSDEQMTGQIVQDSMFELDNLSAYLNKLKDMVRADYETTPLHIGRFDLKELIVKVIRLTHIPQGKEVRFETCYEMESSLIEADPVHVANVLSNLVENAIKYSDERVNITIDARRKGNELWLTVSDDGIGILPAEREKVFAKFYRGSNVPDVTIPGLGLGLSYVKLISEAHRGSVSLISRLGEGTAVTLYLPQ
ncbi:MAG: HAMP domain-containing histidine kinase [Tannerellaceae bacterium]|jgi:two-component system phosphate regulon sensor histidine kinase PhoR|nr:HAMP domain-containing histidine kinase [Tannerellaceae bacterium]